MDKALLSISPACCGQLVEMLITLEPRGIFESNLHTYLFEYCPATGMQNVVKGMPRLILADQGLSVKMLKTLEQLGTRCYPKVLGLICLGEIPVNLNLCQSFISSNLRTL